MDVVFLAGPQVRLSRSLPALGAAELAGQIADSLGVLRWRDVEAVWVSGDATEPLLGAPELAGMARDLGVPPLARDVEPLAEQLTIELGGKGLLALATALGARQPALDLLPPALRPLVLTPRHAVTGGLGAAAAALLLAALLLHGHRDARYLERLDQATRALDGEARAVDALGNELGGARRLLASLRTIESSGLKPLPLLRELTEVLPADAWLGSLSVDPRGLELSGQANAASQLIPMLESSPWLERVEFTSPVVRGRDKEQFRLRATWESGPGGPPEAAPASAPAVSPAPAAPAAPRTPTPGAPTPPRRSDPRRSG
jgi:Tfp pilus assembly protein PilN